MRRRQPLVGNGEGVGPAHDTYRYTGATLAAAASAPPLLSWLPINPPAAAAEPSTLLITTDFLLSLNLGRSRVRSNSAPTRWCVTVTLHPSHRRPRRSQRDHDAAGLGRANSKTVALRLRLDAPPGQHVPARRHRPHREIKANACRPIRRTAEMISLRRGPRLENIDRMARQADAHTAGNACGD